MMPLIGVEVAARILAEAIPLRHKNTIAGRVVAAILRTEIDPSFLIAESVAYKCAFDSMGSNALKHCEAARVDADIMRQQAFWTEQSGRLLAGRMP